MKKLLNIYRNAYSGLPKSAWLLSAVVFVNYSGSMVLFFMTLYLTRKLGFPVWQAGRMISIYGLGSLLGSYLGGWLSDIIGTKRVQFFSLLCAGFGYIVLGYLRSPISLGITMFVLAIIAESFRPANVTAMAEVCPPQIRPRGFALNRLAVNLGITIGPAIGGWLAVMDYIYLFWVDGLTYISAAILFFLLFRSDSDVISSAKKNDTPANASPWKDPPFLITLGACFLIGILFYQLFNTWPLYLREYVGLSEDRIGLLLSMNGIMIVLIEMPLIHRLEKTNPLRIISWGSLLLFSGFVLLPFGRGYSYAALMVVIWTMGEIMAMPLISTFIASRAPDRSRGKYMGMYTFVFASAFVAGPALGTWIYETLGPFYLWTGLGVIGVIVWAGIRFADRLVSREHVGPSD